MRHLFSVSVLMVIGESDVIVVVISFSKRSTVPFESLSSIHMGMIKPISWPAVTHTLKMC